MREHEQNGFHVWTWEDATAFMDATARGPSAQNAEHRWARRLAGDGWDTGFTGAPFSVAQTMRHWEAGAARLADMSVGEFTLPHVQSRRRKTVWREDGDEFSRERFDAGRDDCWGVREHIACDSPTGIVRITAELVAPGYESAESLMYSGLAALKIADNLEAAGYRVEIDVVKSNGGLDDSRQYKTVDIVPLKRASDPLDIDSLAFALGHSIFYRYHGFSSSLRRPVQCAEGLGRVIDTPTWAQGDIHIPRAFTRADAIRVAADALRKFSENSLAMVASV